MRLQDLFSEAYPFEVQTTDGRIHKLMSASQLSTRVAKAPVRYVLDDPSVAMVTHCAFDDDSLLGDSIDLLRIPAEQMWIEWSDRSSVKYLEREVEGKGVSADRAARRVGVLIETDDKGRMGEVRTAWCGDSGEVEMSPFIAEFDFDRPVTCPNCKSDPTFRHIHIRGLECLDPFFACVRYRLDPTWEVYYRDYCKSKAHHEQTVKTTLSHIGGDFPIAAMFLLMLSTRTAFEERGTRFTKLNSKRAKKGKFPLLDHIEVRLNLSPSERRGGLGEIDRTAPRLHHVSGHLVRRGATLYWRKSHLRGNPDRGAITAKTIAVTTSPVRNAA